MGASILGHRFSGTPSINIPRSTFNRRFGHKTTFNSGWLVPIMSDIAYPGDTHKARCDSFFRLATPKLPLMDNLFIETFFFSVPIRLIWDNFRKFLGEQDNPGDSTSFLIPQTQAPAGGYVPPANWASPTGAELSSALFDYFAVPTRIANILHSSLWARAYNLIFNEWFRDQNLQSSLTVPKGDGPDAYTTFALKRRGRRHDYFTSCLPWPQKGTAVTLPLGTSAPLTGSGNLSVPQQQILVKENTTGGTDRTSVVANRGGAPGANDLYVNATTGTFTAYFDKPAQNIPFSTIAGGLTVNLTGAAGATVDAIREAFQIQNLYALDARSGTRMIEIVKAHFGVDSPDLRAVRPEYLGGGSSKINIHPIPQQSATGLTGSTTPLGSLAAFGTASINGHGFVKSFTEHCLIIGLVNVRCEYFYQQGLDRTWSDRTKLDLYWPALAHLGEQAVLNREIYMDGSGNDTGVFGYQERHGHLRMKNSMITGKFRSNDPQSLHAYHLAQQYGALPVLNDSFIQENPPLGRVVVTPTEPEFIGDVLFDYTSVRPMPVYGTPGLVDHF